MKRQQRTIGGPVEFTGQGLFSGVESSLRLLPACAGQGIVFRRTDLSGAPDIPAELTYAVEDPARVTSLENGVARVRMVEHVLSSAFGLGVDNLLVEVGAEEIPAGDGSASTFVDMIRSAGIVEQTDSVDIEIIRFAIQVGDSYKRMEIVPCAGGRRVSYVLDYGDRFVGTQTVSFLLDERTYVEQVAPARTFVLRPEIEGFLSVGLGGGATAENLVVLEEDGAAEGGLRFPDECARHKIVDILGDLSLAGRPFHGHVRGRRTGHADNLELAAKMRDSWDKEPAWPGGPAPGR